VPPRTSTTLRKRESYSGHVGKQPLRKVRPQLAASSAMQTSPGAHDPSVKHWVLVGMRWIQTGTKLAQCMKSHVAEVDPSQTPSQAPPQLAPQGMPPLAQVGPVGPVVVVVVEVVADVVVVELAVVVVVVVVGAGSPGVHARLGFTTVTRCCDRNWSVTVTSRRANAGNPPW